MSYLVANPEDRFSHDEAHSALVLSSAVQKQQSCDVFVI